MHYSRDLLQGKGTRRNPDNDCTGAFILLNCIVFFSDLATSSQFAHFAPPAHPCYHVHVFYCVPYLLFQTMELCGSL